MRMGMARLTQEEINRRCADLNERREWWRTWKSFQLNTNTPQCIRVLVIDGELWFLGRDLFQRLGFTNMKRVRKWTQTDEVLYLEGVTGFSSLTPDPRGISKCYIINVYGLMRITDAIRQNKSHTYKLRTETYTERAKFAEWLERVAIPKAEQKARAMPTLDEERQARLQDMRTVKATVSEQLIQRINEPVNEAPAEDFQEVTEAPNEAVVEEFHEEATDTESTPVFDTQIDKLLAVVLDDINDAEANPNILTTYGPEIPDELSGNALYIWITRQLYEAYAHGKNGTVPTYWDKYVRELDPEWRKLKELAERFNVEITEVA